MAMFFLGMIAGAFITGLYNHFKTPQMNFVDIDLMDQYNLTWPEVVKLKKEGKW